MQNRRLYVIHLLVIHNLRFRFSKFVAYAPDGHNVLRIVWRRLYFFLNFRINEVKFLASDI